MIKPDVVDRVIGAKNLPNYQKVLDGFIQEQTRAYTNEKRYAFEWARSLKTQLQADLAFAEKVSDDYLAFLEGVSSRGAADLRQGEKIMNVFTLAISVLMLVNDDLDDMFSLGIASLLGAIATAGMEREANDIQARLKKLVQELEKAKREVEAYAQTALNLAITAALACAGPLGWVTLGAVGLGEIIADTYLGPAASDAATWGNRGNTTLGTALSASQIYLQESSRAMKVVKPAGKAIPVVGFIFDVNEIAVGYSNVAGLKALMADVEKAARQTHREDQFP